MPLLLEPWPVPMRRVAVVAPESRFRRVLVELADSGRFEPDPAEDPSKGPIGRLAEHAIDATAEASPLLSLEPVDAERLSTAGDFDLLLGEASLEATASAAHLVGRCRVLPGWMRADDVDPIRADLDPMGGSIADLPGRPGLVPPTAHADSRTGAAFRPLVTTYATVPYRDIDPTLFAAIAYMVMFGMMFGDVAHGAAIVAVGLLAFWSPSQRFGAARRAAPFLVGAGAAATAFGFLYGDAFGPTGLVPTLWLRPLDEPEQLLAAGLAVGGVLLAMTFAMSTVNRWREGGPAVALYDPSGVAGALLLAGLAGWVIGVATDASAGWSRAGAGLIAAGVCLVFIGLFVRSGSSASGLAQTVVELFDTLLRLGSNVVSFTRLAAFGLTHAVITGVVWAGTVALWDRSDVLGIALAVMLFTLGNLAAFALGALVGAVQALRLEYYELFSRLFASSGRAFAPWHVPARRWETQ